MKKTMTLILALLLALCLGCAAQAEEKDHLARILEKGEIVVATEGNWSPWTYHDLETNKLVGFDVEVAERVAEKLGVKVVWEEVPWDSIFAGLNSRRYDMAANGVEIMGSRAEQYSFSAPYCYIRTALVVRSDNESIHTFEDLKGRTTANSIASSYMLLAQSYGAQATGVDTLDQTIRLVLTGRADATLNADVSIYDYMRMQPDAAIKVVALTEEASRVAFPVLKNEDNATLVAALDEAVAALREEGVLSELSIKYFGSDVTQPPAEDSAEAEAPAETPAE